MQPDVLSLFSTFAEEGRNDGAGENEAFSDAPSFHSAAGGFLQKVIPSRSMVSPPILKASGAELPSIDRPESPSWFAAQFSLCRPVSTDISMPMRCVVGMSFKFCKELLP